MNKSENIEKLAQALCVVQAKLPKVPLNSDNPVFGKYADLAAVIEVAKPIIAENGLAISQLVSGDGHNVGVTTMLIHTSGQWLETTVTLAIGEGRGNMSPAQVAGATITYLRRYSYSAILGLVADEDKDGNIPRQRQTRPQSKPQTDQDQTIRTYWSTKRAALIERIKAIPYYGDNVPHIVNSLTKLTKDNKLKSTMTDDQVFTIVNDHAKQAADREAA